MNLDRKLWFYICLIAMSLLTSAALADVIGSYTINGGTNSVGEIDWAINLAIIPQGVGWPATVLFNGPDSDEIFDFTDYKGIDLFSNIGQTFWTSSNQDDPEYGSFINQITDGESDFVRIWLVDGLGGLGYLVPLKEMMGQSGNPDFVDLQGYSIGRIGLTINSASHSIEPGNSFPNHYTWSVTCTFEDTSSVPEPTSLLALITGFGSLLAFRIRRHR